MRGQASGSKAREVEPFLQLLDQAGWVDRPHRPGGENDGQWNAVPPGTRGQHSAAVRRREPEGGPDHFRSRHEQLDGRARSHLVEGRIGREVEKGRPETAPGTTCSLTIPSASRLVTNTVAGEPSTMRLTTSRASITCSKLSSTSRAFRSRRRSSTVWARLDEALSAMASRRPSRCQTSSGPMTSRNGTHHAPSSK